MARMDLDVVDVGRSVIVPTPLPIPIPDGAQFNPDPDVMLLVHNPDAVVSRAALFPSIYKNADGTVRTRSVTLGPGERALVRLEGSQFTHADGKIHVDTSGQLMAVVVRKAHADIGVF